MVGRRGTPLPGSGARQRRVTVVMYHFVRNLRYSRYPAIKGLDTVDFAGQLEYIRKHYNVVRMQDVIAAAQDPAAELPERALLLTFDDGYADHYQNVFPVLDEFDLPGAFFPPARAVLERRVLDVNKIHFLLAAVSDTRRIVAALETRIEASRGTHVLKPLAEYRETYAHGNRWDNAETIYIKRLLQKGLPGDLRSRILGELFAEFVSADEQAFAEELYVSVPQLRCMLRHGMHVGSHGHEHVWLDSLPPSAQELEVHRSLRFLEAIGCDSDEWVMCYPYGGVNQSLLDILAENRCRVGLTTELGIADLNTSSPLLLARIDTNDLPTSPNARPNAWTRAAA